MDLADTAAGSNGNATAYAELQQQLQDPATAAALRDIVSKLDVIQFSVSTLDGALRRAESITDNVADGVAEARGAIDPQTVNALSRLVAMTPALVDSLEKLAPALESDALEKLGDPKLVESLANLAQHAPTLAFAADAATGFMQRAEEIADNMAGGFDEVRGIVASRPQELFAMLSQLGSLLPAVQTLLTQVAPLLESGAIEALVHSTILQPENVQAVSQVGDALKATTVAHAAAPKELGLFGMMSALRDPDAKRAMGFFATFLQEFGKRLR